MNKKTIIISIAILLIIICIVLVIAMIIRNNNNNANNINAEDSINNENILDNEDIEEQNTVNTNQVIDQNIFEVQKEYDGREILNIKPEVQYKTVLAGILKDRKPTIEEVNNVDLSKFSKGGIWVSETSRDKFIKILKECGVQNFNIDSGGYLYKTEGKSNIEYSNALEKLAKSNKLTIIDIKGKCYIRDEVSGEVVEYPFEEMDPGQACEIFETKGSRIFVITTKDIDKNSIMEELCYIE